MGLAGGSDERFPAGFAVAGAESASGAKGFRWNPAARMREPGCVVHWTGSVGDLRIRAPDGGRFLLGETAGLGWSRGSGGVDAVPLDFPAGCGLAKGFERALLHTIPGVLAATRHVHRVKSEGRNGFA